MDDMDAHSPVGCPTVVLSIVHGVSMLSMLSTVPEQMVGEDLASRQRDALPGDGSEKIKRAIE
jgi:hypothetical protein